MSVENSITTTPKYRRKRPKPKNTAFGVCLMFTASRPRFYSINRWAWSISGSLCGSLKRILWLCRKQACYRSRNELGGLLGKVSVHTNKHIHSGAEVSICLFSNKGFHANKIPIGS